MSALGREWARGPQFASEADRRKWEPVLRAAAALWDQLEVLSVASGVRPSALLYMTPEEIVRSSSEAAENAFDVVPLQLCGNKIRAAVCPAPLRRVWTAAWKMKDDSAIGRLLGFPDCCVRHFGETWARGTTDTVTPMATVEGPPEANVMLRHLGVRLVPHLPCSASCPVTVAFGERIAAAGVAAGLDLEPLYRVLRLPVSYSSVHGVAITETPHFRVLSGTDQSAEVRSASRSAVPSPEPKSCEDNGFSSDLAMRVSHAILLQALEMRGDAAPESALDLGAGDGALLDLLRGESRSASWVGVEQDRGRADRGRQRHPGVLLHNQTIQEWAVAGGHHERNYDVALITPGRLLEMAPEDAARVREVLSRVAVRLLVYTYGDGGDLSALCARAGVEIVGTVVGKERGAQAAEGRI